MMKKILLLFTLVAPLAAQPSNWPPGLYPDGSGGITVSGKVAAGAACPSGVLNGYVCAQVYTPPTPALQGFTGLNQNGTATPNKIAFISDSWAEMVSLTNQLEFALEDSQGNSGIGYISPFNSTGNSPAGGGQSRTGTWTIKNANTDPTAFGVDGYEGDSTDTVTPATVSVTCNSVSQFVIHYKQQTSGGSFTWKIDAGGATTISTSGATSYQTATVSAGSIGTHTLTLTITVAGSGVGIMGADCQNALQGATVHMIGRSGARTQDYVNMSPTVWAGGLAALNPTTVILMLGVNDMLQSVNPSTTYTNMATLISRIQADVPNAAIYVATQTDGGFGAQTYPLSAYVQAESAVTGLGVGFIDDYTHFGPFNTNLGLYLGNQHPNTGMSAAIAYNILGALYGSASASSLPMAPNFQGSVVLYQSQSQPVFQISNGGTPNNAYSTWTDKTTSTTMFAGSPAGANFSAAGTSTNNSFFVYTNNAQAAQFDTSKNFITFNHINQNATKDFSGNCTMTSGACSAQSFVGAYSQVPNCTCSWNGTGTLTGLLKCISATGSVTPTSTVGTDTAVVTWMCVGNPN